MDTEEFREFAKSAVDYIADYFENIRSVEVKSAVKPGYLKSLLPKEAPIRGEHWTEILSDVDQIIMPGLTHWHSPNFHSYYPTGNSFAGTVGELFLSGLGTVSWDWFSNPACTELEVKMMDWLAKLLDLPEKFLNSNRGPGGGVIQNAASESTLLALLIGKQQKIKAHKDSSQFSPSNLTAYTSDQSNSSVEKAGLLASVQMRLLQTDQKGSLRGETVLKAIEDDISMGLVPCCVVATLGTTGTCAFDNLQEIASVCYKYSIWLHVDAAYAGSAFACPELRHLMSGIELVDSFNFNPHKWMLVNSDCSAMWFRETEEAEALLKSNGGSNPEGIPSIHNWQIPNCRRFRALKLWFVLRIYGVEGIQKHIRKQIELAGLFRKLVGSDHRFEILAASMGVVCFRLKGDNQRTQQLLDRIDSRRKILVMPYFIQKRLVARFVICSRFTEESDVAFAWNEIQVEADDLLNKGINSKLMREDAVLPSNNLISNC